MENEGQESVTETSESTESQSEGTESSQESAAAAQAAAAPKTDETPFHEHPRFKELVEQKNAALQSTRALELKIAQLEGRIQATHSPKAQAEKDALIEEIRTKVDPRLADKLEAFGKYGQTIESLQKQVQDLLQGNQQTSQQAVVKESVARINGWHEANKVPAEIKAAINAQLDVQYMQGKLSPQNLQAEYDKAYAPYKSFLENYKKETLKGYVQDKKVASSVPASQPKSAPQRTGKPAELPKFKDREELRAHVAKEFVKQQAAKREASSV